MADYDSAQNAVIWSTAKWTKQKNTKSKSWIAGSPVRIEKRKKTNSHRTCSSAWRQVKSENLYNRWVVPTSFDQVTWFRRSAVHGGLRLVIEICWARRPRKVLYRLARLGAARLSGWSPRGPEGKVGDNRFSSSASGFLVFETFLVLYSSSISSFVVDL